MLTLEGSPDSQSAHVITIQESYQKVGVNTILCPSSTPFRSLYPSTFRIKTCFLINKRLLPIGTWIVEFPGEDLAVLIVTLRNRTIIITNVYSVPPRSHNEMNESSPMYAIPDILRRPGCHMVMSDFNIHHAK